MAGAHRLLHIDPCLDEPTEMLFLSLRVNKMVSLISPLKTIYDERAKYPMLFVDAIKERTNKMIPAENTPVSRT